VLVFRVNTTTGVGETSGQGAFGVPPDQWTHIAGTFNGNTLKLYVNGILVPNSGGNLGSTATTSANQPLLSPVQLVSNPNRNFVLASSYWNGLPSYPFFGEIDEVEIFDRALSASEIQAVFNAGSAGKCKTTQNQNQHKAKLTVRKIIDQSAWPHIPAGASFPIDVSGCNSAPDTVNLVNPNDLSVITSVNDGGTCSATEGTPTGVTLPDNCHWEVSNITDNPLTIVAGQSNVIGIKNTVVCDKPPRPATEHFQCYDIIERPEMKIPVDLVDQFGETKNMVTRPKYLCVPVDKNGEGMFNETDHLLFYELEGGKPVNKDVKIENQFGTQYYRVLKPRLLGVPSLKTVLEDHGAIDFSIKKTFFDFGPSGIYTIQVDNLASILEAPATLTVVEHIQPGVTFAFTSTPNWSCSPLSGIGPLTATCAWTGGYPIPVGPLPPIQLLGMMTGGGNLTNCADVVVGGGATDVDLSNNTSGNCKLGQPNLKIVKKAVNPSCDAGQSCSFEVTITNTGSLDSRIKCNTQARRDIGCCDGKQIQTPQQ